MQIGDNVRFLNAVGGGRISRIDAKKHLVYVEDEDGFEIPCLEQEVVLVAAAEARVTGDYSTPESPKVKAVETTGNRVPQDLIIGSKASVKKEKKEAEVPGFVSYATLQQERQQELNEWERELKTWQAELEEWEAELEEKEKQLNLRLLEVSVNTKPIPQKKEAKRIVSQSSKPGLLEVDLHINELLDSTAGMDNKAMLEYQLKVFRVTMRENLKKKGQKIVFIHGKGEGVLRAELLRVLKREFRQCSYQDASFQEYGFGATQVTIH